MNKTYSTYNQLIVFSGWTGNSYAVFSGLKKVIKIASLRIDLCAYALQKLKKVITDCIFCEILNEQQNKSELDLFTEEQLLNFVNPQLIEIDYYSDRINLFYNNLKSALINFKSCRLFLCYIS